jgi:hypothetical protein
MNPLPIAVGKKQRSEQEFQNKVWIFWKKKIRKGWGTQLITVYFLFFFIVS